MSWCAAHQLHTSGYPGHAYVNVYILWVDYYHTLLAEIYVYVHVYVFYFNLLTIVWFVVTDKPCEAGSKCTEICICV